MLRLYLTWRLLRTLRGLLAIGVLGAGLLLLTHAAGQVTQIPSSSHVLHTLQHDVQRSVQRALATSRR